MTATPTLADLATTHPAASRVFQRHGLDYCCGGRTSLADACHAKGLDPAAVLDEIAHESTPSASHRWDLAPLPDLIAFIVATYHERLRAEIPELVKLAQRVESEHGGKPSCPRGLAAQLAAIQSAVEDHLLKEERVLFPMILAGTGARASGPVRVMEEEHDDHRRNLARVRSLTNDLTPPIEACASWRALYLRLAQLESELFDHIHLENNVLFPRALNE